MVIWPRWLQCPYMVKYPLKILFSETTGQLTSNLVYSIKDCSPIKFVQMMILGWPWTTLQHGQTLLPSAFVWGKCLNTGFYRNYRSLWTESFFVLCWDLTSQSTIFQSCRDGATASWVINQYFGGVKCLAQEHNTAAVGFEPPNSRSKSDTLPLSHRAPLKVSTWISMWYQRSGSLFDLWPRSLRLYFQTYSQAAGHIKVKFQ